MYVVRQHWEGFTMCVCFDSYERNVCQAVVVAKIATCDENEVIAMSTS